MSLPRVARIAFLALVSAGAPSARAQDLTVAAAQQQLRAASGLPVPVDSVSVSDTIRLGEDWVATANFAGTSAHIKFRRAGDKWIPAEMSYRGGWVPLAKGFTILTEFDETGAKSLLRAIASGQFTYAAVCAPGFYAPTLAALATPEKGQPNGFILKDMVPPPGTTLLEKDHYTIRMTAPPSPRSPRSCNGVPAGQSAQTWSVTARRHKGFGGKSFMIDAEGKLSEIK